MENEAESKKQAPVFFKILLGVIGVYLAVNFLTGSFFGKGVSLKRVTANNTRALGMLSEESFGGDTEMMSDAVVGAPAPMMAKSAPTNRDTDVRPMPIPDRGGNPVPNVDKKIIKNGFVELKVDDAVKSAEKISEIAKKFGGDVSSSNSHRQSNGSLRGNLTIRVSVDKFEETMKVIKKAGEKIISESLSASDVTMEYIDLQARLNNKKAEEEIFRKLLDRSGGLKDVLSVTRELTRVRSEIDSLEGQLKYMTNQTAMSTINVTLTEFVQIATDRDSWKPWRVVKASLHNLVLNSQNFVDSVIRFVIVQLPILIVVSLLILGGYKGAVKIYRKFRK